MGAHLIFFIIFTLFSCIILTNQSLPWYSLRSGFQCDTNMAAVFSGMRPIDDIADDMFSFSCLLSVICALHFLTPGDLLAQYDVTLVVQALSSSFQ